MTMRTITVKVTQEHIDKGLRALCARCPLALSLRASGYPRALVEGDCWVPDCKAWHRLPLSKTVMKFIDRFDASLPVRPASFRLQAPDAAPGAERTR